MTRDPNTPRPSDLDLPWYVIERLDAEETARLEAALAQDLELARHLEVTHEERIATVRLNEALDAPPAAAREALFARIDADVARRRPIGNLLSRLSAFLAGLSPPVLATAALAAFAIIVIQGALLSGAFQGGSGPGYTTASAPGEAIGTGEILLVGFVPTATTAEIIALLDDAHASVVSGPRPGGLFEIKIADRRLSSAELQSVITRLRERTGVVRFVASEGGGR